MESDRELGVMENYSAAGCDGKILKAWCDGEILRVRYDGEMGVMVRY